MDLLIVLLFLGPIAAIILTSRSSEFGSALAAIIGNVTALAIWALVCTFMFKWAPHWVAMVVSWAGIIFIQAGFFYAAVAHTRFGKDLDSLVDRGKQ